MRTKLILLIWFAANIAGLVYFLHYAAWLWAPYGARPEYYDPDIGDHAIFLSRAFPYFISSLVGNLACMCMALQHHMRPRIAFVITFLALTLLWSGAISYDDFRTRDGTNAELIRLEKMVNFDRYNYER